LSAFPGEHRSVRLLPGVRDVKEAQEMGVKTQGGMWCNNCQQPVAGQKTTHRFRNLASFATLGATGGLSMLGFK
jgi:hypothetical protein